MKNAHRRALVAPVLALAVTLTGLTGTPAHAADKDCGDFATQMEAQIFFLQQGGPADDPHRLDADGDGIVCESLPGPYYHGTTLPDGVQPAPKPKPKVIRQRARVVRVVDGDTVKVRLASGARRNVRLIGIDTPEVFGGAECGGRKASASMRQLTPRGTRVVLVSDPSQQNVDRYGRLLRYVMKNGRDMNRAQVMRGWGKVYVYAGKPFRRTADYRASQRKARSHQRGVWRLCR